MTFIYLGLSLLSTFFAVGFINKGLVMVPVVYKELRRSNRRKAFGGVVAIFVMLALGLVFVGVTLELLRLAFPGGMV